MYINLKIISKGKRFYDLHLICYFQYCFYQKILQDLILNQAKVLSYICNIF